MTGTPKTLTQAIQNGEVEFLECFAISPDFDVSERIRIIRNHVVDFLAQKFGIAYLDENINMQDLFQMIVSEHDKT